MPRGPRGPRVRRGVRLGDSYRRRRPDIREEWSDDDGLAVPGSGTVGGANGMDVDPGRAAVRRHSGRKRLAAAAPAALLDSIQEASPGEIPLRLALEFPSVEAFDLVNSSWSDEELIDPDSSGLDAGPGPELGVACPCEQPVMDHFEEGASDDDDPECTGGVHDFDPDLAAPISASLTRTAPAALAEPFACGAAAGGACWSIGYSGVDQDCERGLEGELLSWAVVEPGADRPCVVSAGGQSPGASGPEDVDHQVGLPDAVEPARATSASGPRPSRYARRASA